MNTIPHEFAIGGVYFPPLLIAGIGTVYIIGRFMYWRAYVTEPSTRAPGFILSILSTLALIVLTLVGIALSVLIDSNPN